MSRKKVLQGGTKDEIIQAALTQFMENGYEKTTVRMILEQSGAVVGSFYHYFGSKEELFEAAIELFLQKLQEGVFAITTDNTKSFLERLNLLLDATEQGIQNYFGKLDANQLHWTIQYALHKRAMQSILPCVQHMVEHALEDGTAKNRLNMDTHTLSAVVLQGIEGILHARPLDAINEEQMRQTKAMAVEYVVLILGMNQK